MKVKTNDKFANADGREILCLSNSQDGPKGKHFGFFTQTNSLIPTFFGKRLSKITKRNGWSRIK